MATAPLARIVDYCNKLLDSASFTDWDGAVNGLQVQNRGDIHRIAAAVDGSQTTIRMAIAAKADLLIVHHGLFWNPSHPWTGQRYEMLRLLLDHDLAVYSSHLPLDAHPRLGNNAQLAGALGFKRMKPFFFEKGRFIGLQTSTSIARAELNERLTKALGHSPILLGGGGGRCHRIGIVTGGAGGELKKAAQEGVDTFITGEGPHWSFGLAEELGINVFLGGHYATETFGVKSLAAELSGKFGVPWIFLDHPSGL